MAVAKKNILMIRDMSSSMRAVGRAPKLEPDFVLPRLSCKLSGALAPRIHKFGGRSCSPGYRPELIHAAPQGKFDFNIGTIRNSLIHGPACRLFPSPRARAAHRCDNGGHGCSARHPETRDVEDAYRNPSAHAPSVTTSAQYGAKPAVIVIDASVSVHCCMTATGERPCPGIRYSTR
jgi:hypothetical protein